MGRLEKVLSRVLRGASDRNIPFRDICWLLEKLDFTERVRGGHHIFSHSEIEEVINLQPKRSKAKVYQVRQVREILTRYGLANEEPGDDITGKPDLETSQPETPVPEDDDNESDSAPV